VNESDEGVLAVIGLGATAAPAPRTSTTQAPPPASSEASPSRWRLVPSASAPGAPLGVTAAVHAATSLRAAFAPAPTSDAMPPLRRPLPQELVELPSPVHVAPDWLRIIAKRRSVRRYATTPLSLQSLADVLSRMTALHGPMLSPAVHVNVVVHAVSGLPPGAYRYEPALHALVRRRGPSALRDAARAAALDQDVIGDAAAVFVLSIDRATFAADPFGPARGYRHAFIEAGLIGERVYLEAVARGLGACAVGAFYDDEAAVLVGVDPAHEWVVHFAALGVKG